VVIVDQSFARGCFGADQPLGGGPDRRPGRGAADLQGTMPRRNQSAVQTAAPAS
jgi:hypothetical protein